MVILTDIFMGLAGGIPFDMFVIIKVMIVLKYSFSLVYLMVFDRAVTALLMIYVVENEKGAVMMVVTAGFISVFDWRLLVVGFPCW